MNYSIKVRLLSSLVASLVGMFVLLWLVVGGSLRELTAGYLEDRMALEIASILAELRLEEEDTIALDESKVDSLFRFAFSGYYYQIRWQGAEAPQLLRSRSLGEHVLDLPVLPVGAKSRLQTRGPRQESLLVLIQVIPLREKVLTIAVAENLTPIEEDLEAFQWHYALISLGFLILLAGIHVRVVQQAMLPIESIRKDVAQLEEGRIHKLREDVPLEMREIVRQINHLSQRMEQRMERSRSTIANLAHAMKGPITALAQIVQHPVLGAEEVLRQEVEERLRTLAEMVERELRRARLSDHPFPGRFFYPEQSLGALARTMKSIYFQKQLAITLQFSPGLVLPYDQEDMTEMLGNLLDNACKWAQGAVMVSILEEKDGNGQVFLVEDDGPGVSAEGAERLAGRGVRMDESREGHGLGLFIVEEIVRHYGGALRFLRSPTLGGFRAEVVLPDVSRPY